MSVANTNVGTTYICNGVTTSFPITFAYVNSTQVWVYVIEILTGIVSTLTVVTDYTLSPDAITPTSVVLLTAPSSLYRVRVERVTPLQQTIEYVANSGFQAKDHETGMDKLAEMIQELGLKSDNSLKVSRGDYGASMTLGKLAADALIQVNPLGTGVIVGLPLLGQVQAAVNTAIAASGSGVPAGGLQYATLEKLSAVNGAAAWTLPLAYAGISALTGTLFTSNGIKDTLDKIIRITYTPASISLSGSSNFLREKGNTVASVLLTASTTKQSNPIGAIRFYQGATLINTATGGGIPNGGTNTHTYATAFSDDITFSAQVDDTLSGGVGPTTSTSSTTYSFVYPYYFGGGAAALGAGVAGLTKDITSNTSNYSKTIVSAGAQKLYIAYPAAYGTLTSILDINNFEVLSSFTTTTANITGLNATVQSYRIYESNSLVVAGSYFFQFKK